MTGFWPFNAGKCLREALKQQIEENVKACREHQEVTDRIVAKAERIVRIAKRPHAAIVSGRKPEPRGQ